MNSFQFIKIFSLRQSFRLENIYFLLKDKRRQFSELAKSQNLNKAVVSSVKTPIEGSRHEIGEIIFEHLPNGTSRCYKIYGVQSGGFSNVYTIIDLNGMKPYCLKENRAKPGNESIKNQELLFEAEISLELGCHPHLVATHSVFYYKNRVHLLNEYVSGKSLDLLIKNGSIPLKTALKYALHICYAMLHAKKIFPYFRHGDIKPGNCLITEIDELKLSDFGQTVIDKSAETKGKLSGGTYYYMSPEMFDVSNSNRESCDIYAFGVTLFEMIAKTRPFHGSTRNEIAENHLHEPPPIHILQENSVPESIINLISACLEKKPSDRPQSFAVIEKELKKIYRKEFKETAPKAETVKPDLEELIEKSLTYSNIGDFENALIYVNKALRKDKTSPEALSQKSLILSNLIQEEKALELSSKALSQRNDSIPILFTHAKILFKSQHLNKSLKYIDRVLQLDRNNLSALNLKGEILQQKRQIYEAIKCFEKSLVIDNFQAKATEKLAEIYLSEGFYEKALKIAEKVLARDSRNITLLKISAEIYFLQGKKLKAIEFYKKILSFSHNEKDIADQFINTSYDLFKSSEDETDIDLFEILTLAPNLFYELNDGKPAAYFTEKLIKFVFDYGAHPFVLWLVDDAIVSSSSKISNELRNELSSCLDKISTIKIEKFLASKFLYSIGRIYYELDKIDKCKAIFKQSLALFGDDEKSFYYLGACYEIEEDFQTSSNYYNKALELNGLCEFNKTGVKRVSAKLNEDEHTNSKKILINPTYFELMLKKVFGMTKTLNHQYLLAVIYLSLILFVGFSNYKLGVSHYFVKLANELNSDDYALKAINTENSNPEAYNTRGLLFLRNDDYAKALENFEKASEFRPNDFYLWINIGYTRYKTDNFIGAEAAYNRSLELAPNYAQPHRYLGRLLLKDNRIEEGFEHLSFASKSDFKLYPELLHLARKQFPNNPPEIEKSVSPNDLRSKKILANYLIKHRLLTSNIKSFLTGKELNDREKTEFIGYLIKKKEFQTAHEIWASKSTKEGKVNNSENNLVFDGGFENLTENEETGFGWQIGTENEIISVLIDDKVMHSGKQSLKVKYDGQSRPKSSVVSQMILVKPNQQYRLTFVVKSSELITGGLPILTVIDSISNNSLAQSNPINSTNEKWMEQTLDFRTGETNVINVNLQRISCDIKNCPIIGELWLDDISLKRIGN